MASLPSYLAASSPLAIPGELSPGTPKASLSLQHRNLRCIARQTLPSALSTITLRHRHRVRLQSWSGPTPNYRRFFSLGPPSDKPCLIPCNAKTSRSFNLPVFRKPKFDAITSASATSISREAAGSTGQGGFWESESSSDSEADEDDEKPSKSSRGDSPLVSNASGQPTTPLLPILQGSGSAPGTVKGLSYYPEGFRSMDKGERLLRWTSGTAIVAVAVILVLKFQWLATEILLSTAAVLGGIVGIMILPPLLISCVIIHLLTRLPEAVQDKLIHVAALLWTGVTISFDYLLVLLDLMPVAPVVLSLAASWLVLTLHENTNPRARAADVPLLVSGFASVTYGLGFIERAPLFASLAASGVLSAALSLLPSDSIVSRWLEGSERYPTEDSERTEKEASPVQRVSLAASVPLAASLVAVSESAVVQLVVLVLFCVGAGAILFSRTKELKASNVSIPALFSRVRWGAVFQRLRLSVFSLLKAIIVFTLVASARRVAFELYLKANGL